MNRDPYLDKQFGEPCVHIKELREYLTARGIEIWSEHVEDGWVNVSCGQPGCYIYEGLLHEDWTEEDDDE